MSLRSQLVTKLQNYILVCFEEPTLLDSNELAFLMSCVKPLLSEILVVSHSFCDKCCNLYTPCHPTEWIDTNQELHDYEIQVFSDILLMFYDDIIRDVEKLELNDIDATMGISNYSHDDKLRQLYTVILNYA